MTRYKVMMLYSDGSREEDDEIFETKSEAYEYGVYLCGCCSTGAETLNMSNPGDYPIDEDDDVGFEIIVID